MKTGIMRRLSLSLFFSFAVFIIFLITALIVALISFIAIASGIEQGPGRYSPFVSVLALMLACIIVGTIVSFVFGRYPLKPIRKVIAAINRLATGDFSARLEIAHPPEFDELASSFNRMAQELGSLEMLRADFINNFSHEFKTPIVSIKGFAEMLKYDDLSEAERTEYLNIIIGESNRLASLATNILNLSKVENQVILSQTREYNVTEQIRRCILLFEPKWEEKCIDLLLDLDEMLFNGSEDLLNQVWINLIDNAVKFTPDGGSISIALKVFPQEIRFLIRNDGCGLGAEAVRHIFDKFYQTDASHTAPGYGLGLATAKKNVELHGGSILCNSAVQQGTEFIISLPTK